MVNIKITLLPLRGWLRVTLAPVRTVWLYVEAVAYKRIAKLDAKVGR
jgi:hypothetical protein